MLADEEYHLKDIAFEMFQIEQIYKIREAKIFANSGKLMTKSLKQLKENKKRLIHDYELKFKKTPDIENAKRIFARDAQTDGIAWRKARDVNYKPA